MSAAGTLARKARTTRAAPPTRTKPPPRVAGRVNAARRRPTRAEAAASAASAAPLSDEPSARLLRQFRIVFNAVKAHFQQVERKAGVGGAQVWALAVIREQAGLGVNDLAAALDVRQPTASNLVKALVQQGLAEARREGADRRAVQLYLLPEGRRVLRRTPGPFVGVLPQALAALDPRTLTRMERDLARLIEVLGADAEDGRLPMGSI